MQASLGCKAGVPWALPQQLFAIIPCSIPAMDQLKVGLVRYKLGKCKSTDQTTASLSHKNTLHWDCQNCRLKKKKKNKRSYYEKNISIEMSSCAFFQGKPHTKWSWIPLKIINSDWSHHFHYILYIYILKNKTNKQKKQLRFILSFFTQKNLRTETGH